MFYFYVYNIVHVLISLPFGRKIAPGQLDFQFLAQDFQIQKGGSQDFLFQNISGSTDKPFENWKALNGYFDKQ